VVTRPRFLQPQAPGRPGCCRLHYAGRRRAPSRFWRRGHAAFVGAGQAFFLANCRGGGWIVNRPIRSIRLGGKRADRRRPQQESDLISKADSRVPTRCGRRGLRLSRRSWPIEIHAPVTRWGCNQVRRICAFEFMDRWGGGRRKRFQLLDVGRGSFFQPCRAGLGPADRSNMMSRKPTVSSGDAKQRLHRLGCAFLLAVGWRSTHRDVNKPERWRAASPVGRHGRGRDNALPRSARGAFSCNMRVEFGKPSVRTGAMP